MRGKQSAAVAKKPKTIRKQRTRTRATDHRHDEHLREFAAAYEVAIAALHELVFSPGAPVEHL
jgi:hypothetical protein